MIIRIVKMEFLPEKVEEFQQIFQSSKEKIRNFPGCSHLELLRDKHNSAQFFTYSFWDNEQSLENYRSSDLFTAVWSSTKLLFAQKPLAWSLKREIEI